MVNTWRIFGEILVSSSFFDLSEEQIKAIKYAKENDQSFFIRQTQFEPKKIDFIAVYRTKKATNEYVANSDLKVSEVTRNILCGKIGKHVSNLFFPLSVIDEENHLTIDELIEAANFLGLDENWFISACALALQEVMIEKLAEKKNISLNKESIKKILNKKKVTVSSDYIPFSEKYKAFQKEARRIGKITMPNLTLDFRNTRNDVIHRGYNPTPEESKIFVEYTVGLLKRLKTIWK